MDPAEQFGDAPERRLVRSLISLRPCRADRGVIPEPWRLIISTYAAFAAPQLRNLILANRP